MFFSIFAIPWCIGCFPPPPPPPPPPVYCDTIHIDNSATAKLTIGFPPRAYEYGTSFHCASNGGALIIQPVNDRHSFSFGQPQDPCKVSLPLPISATKAYGHTHPYFNNSDEYRRGVGCHGERRRPSASELRNINRDNRDFGDGDLPAARALDRPLYLGTPLR